jgi:UDP-N-acetylmuramoylalanine--D-glutamate ligase
MDAYAAAKARIFGEHGLMVLNREDRTVMDMLPAPVKVKLQKPQQRAHISFGADLPRNPGDYGIEMVAGMAWLVRALEVDQAGRRARDPQEELHLQRLLPADALRIRGRHNATNALAALALAQAAGAALGPMLYGLREYRGEPHRVEPIGIVQGVEYFDDSKGTNVGATVAALTGLGADRRIVLILGGLGKGQDFTPLAAPVARYVRAVVLIGRDAPLIKQALQCEGVPLLEAADMAQAVQLASAQAREGDAVLMSPACASMDMFRDYAHRAQVFVAAVQELADEAGQILGGYDA